MADSKRLDQFCGFDLGEYRYATAKFLKLLIRARAKDEPGFLSKKEFARWGLREIDQDPQSQKTIVRTMAAAQDHLWRVFLGPNGSGGVPVGDPRAELKEAVAHFASEVDATAIQDQLRQGKPIDWANMVEWERLSTVRDGLDALPHPKQQEPLRAAEGGPATPAERRPVQQTPAGSNIGKAKERWWHTKPADPGKYAGGRIEGTLKQLADALEVDTRTIESLNRNGAIWVQRLHRTKWVITFKDSDQYERAWQRLSSNPETPGGGKPHASA